MKNNTRTRAKYLKKKKKEIKRNKNEKNMSEQTGKWQKRENGN